MTMRPADAALWNADAALDPTPAELIDHVATTLDYARKQLSNAQNAKTQSAVRDCISRAQDALDDVADVHAQLLIALAQASTQDAGNADHEWTVDEILAHAG